MISQLLGVVVVVVDTSAVVSKLDGRLVDCKMQMKYKG